MGRLHPYKVGILKSREEWLTARAGTIGGSDAACIMGLNPWKTAAELFDEMTGVKQPSEIKSEAVQFGIDMEPLIRNIFELEHPEVFVDYEENNLFVSTRFPFAHASLDGWLTKQNGDRGILEIKTASPKNSAGWAEWKDRIPDRYYCQILHYFGVTDWEFAILKAYLRHYDGSAELREYEFYRDEVSADVDLLMANESHFMDRMKNGDRPGRMIDL